MPNMLILIFRHKDHINNRDFDAIKADPEAIEEYERLETKALNLG
jgi:hypothetical protein